MNAIVSGVRKGEAFLCDTEEETVKTITTDIGNRYYKHFICQGRWQKKQKIEARISHSEQA